MSLGALWYLLRGREAMQHQDAVAHCSPVPFSSFSQVLQHPSPSLRNEHSIRIQSPEWNSKWQQASTQNWAESSAES